MAKAIGSDLLLRRRFALLIKGKEIEQKKDPLYAVEEPAQEVSLTRATWEGRDLLLHRSMTIGDGDSALYKLLDEGGVCEKLEAGSHILLRIFQEPRPGQSGSRVGRAWEVHADDIIDHGFHELDASSSEIAHERVRLVNALLTPVHLEARES